MRSVSKLFDTLRAVPSLLRSCTKERGGMCPGIGEKRTKKIKKPLDFRHSIQYNNGAPVKRRTAMMREIAA